MRDPARIAPMLALLGEIWARDPDLRLGQIVVNAARPSEPCPQVFYIEDSEMMRRLESDLRRYLEASDRGPPDDA